MRLPDSFPMFGPSAFIVCSNGGTPRASTQQTSARSALDYPVAWTIPLHTGRRPSPMREWASRVHLQPSKKNFGSTTEAANGHSRRCRLYAGLLHRLPELLVLESKAQKTHRNANGSQSPKCFRQNCRSLRQRQWQEEPLDEEQQEPQRVT